MENEEPKVILSYAKPGLDGSTFLIAYIQKVVVYGSLFTAILLIFSISLSEKNELPSVCLLSIAFLTNLGTSIFAARLSMYVYPSRFEGFLMGLFSLFPLLGLIPIFLINSRASQLLSDRGLKVRFFGTNLEEARRIESAEYLTDLKPNAD